MKTFFSFVILLASLSLSVKAQGFGYALHFDGTDDYIDMGNASTFDVGNAVTYEAWIYPDTSSQTGFIFNKWVDFAEDKQFVYSYNLVYFYLFDVFSGVQLASSQNVLSHQYTHVAATFDASNGITAIYINGVFDTSKSVGSSVSNSAGNLYYGFNPIRGDFIAPFKGIIDEIRIWDIARTESEIQSTMYTELNGNESGLVGYWSFNEGTGTTTADQTTNGNTGTISGAAWVLSGITSTEDEEELIPKMFLLTQNFPNPFNPSTTIQYAIPNRSCVTLKVYDVIGNEVVTLVNEEKPAGTFEVEFSAKGGSAFDGDESQLSSGMYLYRLQAGDFIETKKMILLK